MTNTDLLEKAIQIATEAHKGQVDKGGKPYIQHPLRVADRCRDDNAKIVAVLHDTIEDTFVTPEYLEEQDFPRDIIDGVLSVTHKDGESYDDFIKRGCIKPCWKSSEDGRPRR